jgi:hypothetical protein
MPKNTLDWTWAVHANVFDKYLDGTHGDKLLCKAFMERLLEEERKPRPRNQSVRLRLVVDAEGVIRDSYRRFTSREPEENDRSNEADTARRWIRSLLTEETDREFTMSVDCSGQSPLRRRECPLTDDDYRYVLVADAAGRAMGRSCRLAHYGRPMPEVERCYEVAVFDVSRAQHEHAHAEDR